MDTSIYIGKVIKLLPQTVDIWINAWVEKRWRENHLNIDCLDDIRFKVLHMLDIQLVKVYIYKKKNWSQWMHPISFLEINSCKKVEWVFA